MLPIVLSYPAALLLSVTAINIIFPGQQSVSLLFNKLSVKGLKGMFSLCAISIATFKLKNKSLT